jgi:crotonobetainyl-CoA:carnitine CoA-transferase CaiB-like acyl-CoA transferase
VLDLTHVIAGPVCGRVLAAHGADVLHVTPPHWPVLLDLVRDTDFGKRQCTAGLGDELRALVAGADVFVQSYRPGSLARKGFGPADLARLRPGIVLVSLTAYGHTGPWRDRRGFDSLVQMACGIAAHAGVDEPRPLPAQALDHGTGWLAAYGVMTALRRRATEGGSWHVRLSLARTAEWLHDLGRQEGPVSEVDPTPWLTETDSDFGRLTHIRVPCASVEPAGPRQPGRDPATWW